MMERRYRLVERRAQREANMVYKYHLKRPAKSTVLCRRSYVSPRSPALSLKMLHTGHKKDKISFNSQKHILLALLVFDFGFNISA